MTLLPVRQQSVDSDTHPGQESFAGPPVVDPGAWRAVRVASLLDPESWTGAAGVVPPLIGNIEKKWSRPTCKSGSGSVSCSCLATEVFPTLGTSTSTIALPVTTGSLAGVRSS